MNEGILDVAAELAALGVNPLPLLTTKNDIIRSFYFNIHERLAKIKDMQTKNLAMEIANEVMKRIK